MIDGHLQQIDSITNLGSSNALGLLSMTNGVSDINNKTNKISETEVNRGR